MRTRLLFVCLPLALAVVGCGGPWVMIPGGELSGTPTPVPSDWSFTDEIDTVQLETRPTDPYSVNVWGVAIRQEGPARDAIYVVAGGGAEETTWARHLAEDPRVRLRVGDALYELRAVLDNDDATREAFLVAARAKYDFEPDADQTEEAVVYRLDAR